VTEIRNDHYILFLVNGTTYALPSRDVAHIEMVEQVTTVPNAAAFIDGVVFSRGQVVPAVNMRARFGFGRVPLDLGARLVVVQVHGRRVGLLVDSCRECDNCRAGLQQYCTGSGMVGTYDATDCDGTPTYGGYSTAIVVDENYVLRIPDSIPLDKAAPLLCAGITLFSPLHHWGAGPLFDSGHKPCSTNPKRPLCPLHSIDASSPSRVRSTRAPSRDAR